MPCLGDRGLVAQSPILNSCETTSGPHSSNAEAAQRKLVPETTVASTSRQDRDFDRTTRGIAGRSSARAMTDYGKLNYAAG
jgi:hypothetical protein